VYWLLLLASCGKERADDKLIKSIQEATDKQVVSASDLPGSSQSLLAEDFSESYIELAELAPELGYQVSMRRGVGSLIGEHSYVYFGLDGRELKTRKDKRNRGHKRYLKGCNRHECYELVFPVTFVMPDGTAISGDAETLRDDIREWYKDNRREREKPSLEFPVDIIYEDDGTMVTLENEQDLRSAYEYCKGKEWDKKCFEKGFPLTVTMPDGMEIIMEGEGDWQLIKDWYEANPDIRDDGTVVTIESEEDMRTALEECKEE